LAAVILIMMPAKSCGNIAAPPRFLFDEMPEGMLRDVMPLGDDGFVEMTDSSISFSIGRGCGRDAARAPWRAIDTAANISLCTDMVFAYRSVEPPAAISVTDPPAELIPSSRSKRSAL
jgi:hypothetical protein